MKNQLNWNLENEVFTAHGIRGFIYEVGTRNLPIGIVKTIILFGNDDESLVIDNTARSIEQAKLICQNHHNIIIGIKDREESAVHGY